MFFTQTLFPPIFCFFFIMANRRIMDDTAKWEAMHLYKIVNFRIIIKLCQRVGAIIERAQLSKHFLFWRRRRKNLQPFRKTRQPDISVSRSFRSTPQIERKWPQSIQNNTRICVMFTLLATANFPLGGGAIWAPSPMLRGKFQLQRRLATEEANPAN